MEKNKKKIVKKSTPKASTPKIKKETKTTKVVKKAKTTKAVKAVSAPKTKKPNNNKKVFAVVVIVLLVVAASLVYCYNSKWRRDGDKVYKGNETYEIGDYYEYDETAGQYTDEEDIKWKVLGVNDKGHLLIVSSSSVGQLALGSENAYEKGQNDYLTGIDKMNKIASKYANGKGAVLARSITADDVIKKHILCGNIMKNIVIIGMKIKNYILEVLLEKQKKQHYLIMEHLHSLIQK